MICVMIRPVPQDNTRTREHYILERFSATYSEKSELERKFNTNDVIHRKPFPYPESKKI